MFYLKYLSIDINFKQQIERMKKLEEKVEKNTQNIKNMLIRSKER